MIIFNHYAADRTWLATILGWPEQIKPGIQILPMLIGAALFILFTKLDMTNIQGFGHALVLKTASATFGIYLIHENTFWYRLIWLLSQYSSISRFTLFHSFNSTNHYVSGFCHAWYYCDSF